MTRDLAQHPAIPGAVNVGRRGSLAEIAGRNAIGLDHRLLDQRCVGERPNAVASNAPSTICPRPGFASLNQSGERVPERAVYRAVPKSTQFTAAR